MRKRQLIQLLLLVIVWEGCTGNGVVFDKSRGREQPGPPNILILVTDDQRVDMMAALPRTRRIFGRNGTTFTNAFATTPQCCPSRASIMTGQYSHNHGVLENNDGDTIHQRTTLQYRLQSAGYLTAIAGKYLQGRPVSEDPPFFDRWTTLGWGYYDRKFNVDGKIQAVHQYSTDFLSDSAAGFLDDFERRDERPWLLYIAPSAPHLPYTPARRHVGAEVKGLESNPALEETDLGDKPEYFLDPLLSEKTGFAYDEGRALYRRQMRTLLSVDEFVGDLFGRLDSLDEAANTLAFFVSDNGHLLGEHQLFGKRLPYEASIRIPLLMRWPGHVEEGGRDRRLVAGIDLAPTILQAAGLGDETISMDGRSLLSGHSRDLLLLEQYKNGNIPDWASIRTRKTQYVEYLDRHTGERLYGEFYDLRRDPWQLNNLLRMGDPQTSARAARAARLLARTVDCVGSDCP